MSDWLRTAVEEARAFYDGSSNSKWDKSLLRQLKTFGYMQGSPVAKDPKTQKSVTIHPSIIINNITYLTDRKIIDLSNDLESLYSEATVTKDGKDYQMEPEFTDIMANSRYG
jgi:hypothetical protein